MVSVVPIERIAHRILLVRGRKVLLDSELAVLYGVSTKRFNEQVRRNAARFPEDFMFRLSANEWNSLRSQFATLKADQVIGSLVRMMRDLKALGQPASSRPIGFVIPG